MSLPLQLAYVVRRKLIGWLRIRTRGVKVMLFNGAGELLLIRNSYGNRRAFVLPGGGIGRNETPEAAARREVREELNLELRELTCVAKYESVAEGKRDTIHLFRALTDGDARSNSMEVEEACFFDPDHLPESLSAATRRRLAEIRGERPISDRW